ncbi:hypothetical protein L6R52_22075 [Myxococcota bacterium]|nr:hypothetical protein [Myxococcota bacterium]
MLSRRRAPSFALLALALPLLACPSTAPVDPAPIAATAIAVDANTVELTFTAELDASSVDARAITIRAPFTRPIATLDVVTARAEGSRLTLETATQTGGVLYAVSLGDALRFRGVERPDYPAQVNFTGFGEARVELTIDTRGFQVPGALTALVTLDPATGEYSEQLRPIAMVEGATPGIFVAALDARIDPERTFAARAIGPASEEAGALTTFRIASAAPVTVALSPLLERLPEFEAPVDTTPGDGFAPVRVVFDDRLALELASPALRSSVDATGRFDASAARVDALALVPGKGRVWEVVLEVAVDPARRLDGTSPESFPYVAFLVEAGEDIPQRGTTFVMPTEAPQVVVVPVGNPALVPVKFRVDVKDARLRPDGPLRGRYPGEGIFLTGEFPNSEDALGRLAADSFTGGERATLEMEERPDAPGIFEKTVFMPPNRPYGWKVVRCPTGAGCSELNRHVQSTGRAFPTVMKNLVTANEDAASAPTVVVLDPSALSSVVVGGNSVNYSSARVSSSGAEAPSASVMFKQEVPDLVVDVGTTPVTTPIWVVGTWRDVNLPNTPAEILANDLTIELAPWDYDDGTQGRLPPIRDVTLPDEPGPPMRAPGEPAFTPGDGVVDATAELVRDGGRLPLWVAWNERELYVATDAAPPGRDHFILVSFEAPTGDAPAHWAKAGREATSARQVFLAMEGDGAFQGWFRRGPSGSDDQLLEGAGLGSGRGAVVEGTIDPIRAGLGAFDGRVWIAVVAFASADGGALDASTQSPAGDGDGTVDPAELREVVLVDVRAF